MKNCLIIPGLGCDPKWYNSISNKLSHISNCVIIDWFFANINTIADVINLIEYTRKKNKFKKIYLIGHSLGGIFTLIYYLYYPDKVIGIYEIDAHFTGKLSKMNLHYLKNGFNNMINSRKYIKKLIGATIDNHSPNRTTKLIEEWYYNNVDAQRFLHFLNITNKWLIKHNKNIDFKNLNVGGICSTTATFSFKNKWSSINSKTFFTEKNSAKKLMEYETNFNILVLTNMDHWTFMNGYKSKSLVLNHILHFITHSNKLPKSVTFYDFNLLD